MYKFKFRYIDGAFIVAENVREVRYRYGDSVVCVKENDLLTHDYSIYTDMTLIGDNESYRISAKDLRSIEIAK